MSNRILIVDDEKGVVQLLQSYFEMGGVPVPLSKKEFDIVQLLSLNTGQIFDRERIYESVWGFDSDGNSDTIMEHIRKIRAEFSSCTPTVI